MSAAPERAFDAEGIRRAARWMARRLRNHGMFRFGLLNGDAEAVAIATEQAMRGYITAQGLEATVTRSGSFLAVRFGDDDSTQYRDVSLPLATAIARELGIEPAPFNYQPRTPPPDLFA